MCWFGIYLSTKNVGQEDPKYPPSEGCGIGEGKMSAYDNWLGIAQPIIVSFVQMCQCDILQYVSFFVYKKDVIFAIKKISREI